MLRGLMRMAAIAGAGYAWRKFRNRNSSGKNASRSFERSDAGRHAALTGSERRVAARDHRHGDIG